MHTSKAALQIKDKRVPCRSNTPVWKAMVENGFSRSAYLVIRSGTLITDDEMIRDGDEIELIQVVSGG